MEKCKDKFKTMDGEIRCEKPIHHCGKHRGWVPYYVKRLPKSLKVETSPTGLKIIMWENK